MKAAEIPSHEPARRRALLDYEILDTEPEPGFDALATLAARVADTPIALVSLVDTDRQWFKSCHGLSLRETPRDASFCGHVVADEQPLIVPDALADARFSDNPLVTDAPGIRAYAGFPLRTDEGFVLGTLCVVDTRPRVLSPDQQHALALLADQVVAQLELRRTHRQLARTAEALTNSESRLRAMFESAVDAIITIDERGRIEAINPACEQMFGYGTADLVGQNVSMLMPAPDRQRHDGYIANYLQTGETRIIGTGREVTAMRRDGRTFTAELSVSAFCAGEAHRFMGVLRDVSERKRAERAKLDFVSTVSHELRTPLTSIGGALGLLSAGVAGTLPETAREYVEIARASTERLKRLTDDILDLEKVSSGKMTFRFAPVRLATVVEREVGAARDFAARSEVSLRLPDEPDQGEVLVDEDRLAQVLVNLISNAIKFSPAGAAVDFAVVRDDETIRVEIRDRGPGVPDAFRDRIFQRFSQAADPTTRTRGGAGLGLSIARGLIERMGGRIGYSANEGRGTRFFFELPVLSAAGAPSDGERRALLCENDPEIARRIGEMLRRRGLTVHVAPTLATARALLAHGRYDLVTLEPALAERDAAPLLAEIRSCCPSATIVALSGAVQFRGDELELALQSVGEDFRRAALREYAPEQVLRVDGAELPPGAPTDGRAVLLDPSGLGQAQPGPSIARLLEGAHTLVLDASAPLSDPLATDLLRWSLAMTASCP